LGGLLSILIGAGRVKVAGKGTYEVCEPWAGGEKHVFKSSMARNDVPSQVLLSCPSLVDAKKTTEVEEYLKVFEKALMISTGDFTKEENLNSEDEALNIVGGDD
jgi:hypothetical protein